MDILDELERGLHIDENALEEALQQQPEIFYRVAKKLALEISRRDELKQHLDEVKAEADVAIREEFREDGQKLTEKELDSLVRTDKKVKRAISELLIKQRLVGALQALERSFEQRSYALKNLVELYLQSYYGDPSSGRRDLRERQAQEAREAMARERRTRREH